MSDSENPVPKLPRGPFFSRIQLADIFRIGTIGIALVAVILLREPCSDGVGRYIESLAPLPDAGLADMELIRLTPEEIEKRFPSHDTKPVPPHDTEAVHDPDPDPESDPESKNNPVPLAPR